MESFVSDWKGVPCTKVKVEDREAKGRRERAEMK